MKNRKIIFYDGECGFCNYIVAFILKNEKKPTFYFAALQSDFAKQTLVDEYHREINFDTFYFLDGNELYTKSKGFFQLAIELKYPVRLLRFFRFLPLFITDKLYDFIAKRRKKIGGSTCYIPTPEERKRFI